MTSATDTTNVYTDFQGLSNLKYKAQTNQGEALKQVSHQFEAVFLQFMLKSMREANESFNSGLFDSNNMDFYQGMYDQQLTLNLSQQGIGIAPAIERQLTPNVPHQANKLHSLQPLALQHADIPDHKDEAKNTPNMIETMKTWLKTLPQKVENVKQEFSEAFQSRLEFLQALLPAAKETAERMGVDPKILLAQAALETNWGKNIIRHNDGKLSHNLFGIKAGENWQNEKANVSTLEYRDGIAKREMATFRSYPSFSESFSDYEKLLRGLPRYQEVLQNTHTPDAYANALQRAGYATDPNYAQKILNVMKSPIFNEL